jgi:A/G-specific adenine glycosylase
VCRWRANGPDPATGTAAVTGPQTRFSGSDRQGRGRLVDALRAGPVDLASLPEVMGWPDDTARANRVAATVVTDGLASRDGDRLVLP